MPSIPVRRLGRSATEPALAAGFSIRSIEQVLDGKDMVQPLHRHDHYFLLAITNGEGFHECDFNRHALRQHSIYVMRPGQVHRLEIKAGSSGYIVQFRKDLLATGDHGVRLVLRRVGQLEALLLEERRYAELVLLLDRISADHGLDQKEDLQLVRAYLTAFLTDLALRSASNAPPDHTKAYAQERSEELLDLIETHVHTTKEVSAYAEMMHLSTFQLNAISKAGMGRTCSELITDQLILEAKRYLLATTDQVNQIADRLGYDDVSYFIRFFKKHTGHTPEGFRQRSR